MQLWRTNPQLPTFVQPWNLYLIDMQLLMQLQCEYEMLSSMVGKLSARTYTHKRTEQPCIHWSANSLSLMSAPLTLWSMFYWRMGGESADWHTDAHAHTCDEDVWECEWCCRLFRHHSNDRDEAGRQKNRHAFSTSVCSCNTYSLSGNLSKPLRGTSL